MKPRDGHNLLSAVVALCLSFSLGCSRASQSRTTESVQTPPAMGEALAQPVVLHKIPAGKEYSGFLKDYSNLTSNPALGPSVRTFVKQDEQKNLHKYIAMIVDPVQVYLASDADPSKLPDKGPGVAAGYFHKALVDAVSSAFPVVDESGPLTLRLRTALIGVDAGPEIPAADRASDPAEALDRAVNIEKVGVEMELLDSETGEQIAAMVDRENLGAGAEIGSVHFSREEKWAAAREAFDGWARRVRDFLDSAHELSPEDARRADQSYRPYSDMAQQ
jgi:hypothetical protein